MATSKSTSALRSVQFSIMAAQLDLLAEQLRLFRDPAWLAQQSAADLAVLHGVIADKALQMLSTLESSTRGELTTERRG